MTDPKQLAKLEFVAFCIEQYKMATKQTDDIVTGPVANDNVYLSFNLYESGIITKRELIRRLKTYKLVDQLLFHTERSLDTLKYAGNKEVRI